MSSIKSTRLTVRNKLIQARSCQAYLHLAFFASVLGAGLVLPTPPAGLSNLTVPPPTLVLLVVLAILELVAAVGAYSVEDGFEMVVLAEAAGFGAG